MGRFIVTFGEKEKKSAMVSRTKATGVVFMNPLKTEHAMFEFYMSGGFPMHIISLVGLVCIGAAFFFARVPTRDSIPRVISMSVAVTVAAIAGILSDLAATLHFVATDEKLTDTEAFRVVCQGLSESTSPGIWAGALLVVTWLLMALGFRRLASSPA
jgi:hypothetical protein